MKLEYLIFLFLTITEIPAFAQEGQPFVKNSFVIVQSTKNYDKAKTEAVKASQQLHQKLDLRELTPNKKSGLTYAEKICEDEDGYPCYIARGRYDDGDYVSIEWSNAFTGFTKGYYIVVIYSGTKTAADTILKKAKTVFKEAYAKQSSVYVGCMH